MDVARMDPDSQQPIAGSLHGPDRPIIAGFFIALGLSIAGLLWLAVRAESPASVRLVLDIFVQLALGISVALLAFRALMAFPFRISDLIVMVLVLSLSLQAVLFVIWRFYDIGLLHPGSAPREHPGEIAQTCLIIESLLLAGGSFALRTCHRLKIQSAAVRAITLISGMLVLPGAAGTIAFLVLIGMQVSLGEYLYLPVFALLWLASLGVTILNVINLARLMMLGAEITAQEHLPR
jgi:hypothetical protein